MKSWLLEDPEFGLKIAIYSGFNGKITMFNGKIHYKWPFSIAVGIFHHFFLWGFFTASRLNKCGIFKQ